MSSNNNLLVVLMTEMTSVTPVSLKTTALVDILDKLPLSHCNDAMISSNQASFDRTGGRF